MLKEMWENAKKQANGKPPELEGEIVKEQPARKLSVGKLFEDDLNVIKKLTGRPVTKEPSKSGMMWGYILVVILIIGAVYYIYKRVHYGL